MMITWNCSYGGGKLFLPVENIELLSRYGSDEGAQQPVGRRELAKRKSRDEDAGARDRRLADRHCRRPRTEIACWSGAPGLYDKFCSLPIKETEDQEKAIADAIAANALKEPPMDRLVCQRCRLRQDGSRVRTAFVAAMAGEQTATPIPRTLQMALSGVRDMSVIATPPVDARYPHLSCYPSTRS